MPHGLPGRSRTRGRAQRCAGAALALLLVVLAPLPEPSAAASASRARPVVKIVKAPPARTRATVAEFRFRSSARTWCRRDHLPYRACRLRLTYRGLRAGRHTFTVRARRGGRTTFVRRRWTIAARPAPPVAPVPPPVAPAPAPIPPPAGDASPKLLIADNFSRRLLITDFNGRVIWQMSNPAANPSLASGPLGVRWLPGNQILVTCGTGEVGVIDVASKAWLWQVKGFNGEAFASPYDAELLPDGRLAVALRYNSNGRVSVYDRASGAEVWRHLVPEAHSLRYRTAAQSHNSEKPTILVGGFGNIKEVTYAPGAPQTVAWRVASEFTHDAIVVENDQLITTEGYFIQKINRAGAGLWKHSTPDESRRVAIDPVGGGYIFSVGQGDRIEFRDTNGSLRRAFSQLSDGTTLDYPYGIQVIDYPG